MRTQNFAAEGIQKLPVFCDSCGCDSGSISDRRGQSGEISSENCNACCLLADGRGCQDAKREQKCRSSACHIAGSQQHGKRDETAGRNDFCPSGWPICRGDNAKDASAQLVSKGGAGYILQTAEGKRVLIAGYATREDAENVQQRLLKDSKCKPAFLKCRRRK